MNALRILTLCFLTLGFAGCTRPVSQGLSTSSVAPSTYSSSFSKSASRVSVSAPAPTPAGLIVKPDLIQMNFAFRKTAKTSEEAITALEAHVADLAKVVETVSGGKGKLRPCRFSASVRDDERVVTADGALEIPLSEDLDYWARAKLLAGITEATNAVHTQVDEKKSELGLHVGFSTATTMVQNVEQHRAALTRLWVERARAFIDAAEQANTPLALVECSPPEITIRQQSRGLEEVALSLPLNCKIGRASAKPTR